MSYRRAIAVTGFWALLLAACLVQPAQATDTVVYYHTDALRSVAVVTNSSGAVIERTHYAPYGQVLNRALRDGPGYTGHREDANTGLVYMQQRYYDPESGRFLSTDPVQADGIGGNFNRYAYANNNPYRYTDPDGRCTGSHISTSGGICANTGGYTTGTDGALQGILRQQSSSNNVANSNEYTRATPSAISDVANDASVKKWEANARDSKAFRSRDEYKRREQGVWVYTNDKTREVMLRDMPSSEQDPITRLYSAIVAGAPPSIKGFTPRIAIHTHPFPLPNGQSMRAGYSIMAYPQPSQADVNYVHTYNLDGIVISHDGLYFFGVDVPIH